MPVERKLSFKSRKVRVDVADTRRRKGILTQQLDRSGWLGLAFRASGLKPPQDFFGFFP